MTFSLPGRRGLLAAAVVACAVSALPLPALAQADYPNKPIRLINPYPPGSPVEMVGRLVGERLRQEWGQPVLVESRAGAGGTVGTNYVAQSPADGYTLLVSVPSVLTVAPWTFNKLPYDPVKDMLPVWGVESGGIVMVARPDTGFAADLRPRGCVDALCLARPPRQGARRIGASSHHLRWAQEIHSPRWSPR